MSAKNILTFESPAKAFKDAPPLGLASALQAFEAEDEEAYNRLISKVRGIPPPKKRAKRDPSKSKQKAAVASIVAKAAAKELGFHDLREKIIAVSDTPLTESKLIVINFLEASIKEGITAAQALVERLKLASNAAVSSELLVTENLFKWGAEVHSAFEAIDEEINSAGKWGFAGHMARTKMEAKRLLAQRSGKSVETLFKVRRFYAICVRAPRLREVNAGIREWLDNVGRVEALLAANDALLEKLIPSHEATRKFATRTEPSKTNTFLSATSCAPTDDQTAAAVEIAEEGREADEEEDALNTTVDEEDMGEEE